MSTVADLEVPQGPTLAHPEAVREDALSETQSLKAAVHQAGNEGSSGNNASEPLYLRKHTHGFVGFSNFPQQWHQRTGRNGFVLNVMLVGASGLGKSTLLNTLFEQPLHTLGANKSIPIPGAHATDANASESGAADEEHREEPSRTVGIETSSVDIEENGVRLHLTVIDTPGYGDHINNMDSWKPILDEVDRRFDNYYENETAMNRATAPDTRVHACLYFIQPTGHSLKPLDVVVMRKLHKKVNLIPIIAKADTLTEQELITFKRLVLEDLKFQGIEVFSPPTYEEDDEEMTAEVLDLQQRMPFAVVGSTQLVQTPDGRAVYGRSYPWGVIEVNNEDHNDFVKLRSLLISSHLEDLRDRTERFHYENYRTEKMFALGAQQDHSVFREVDPALRQEEERAQHEERLARMEAEMRQVFLSKVTEKEAKLKKSENDLFTKHKEIKDNLDKQRASLEAQKAQLEQQAHAPPPPVVDEKKGRKGFSLR